MTFPLPILRGNLPASLNLTTSRYYGSAEDSSPAQNRIAAGMCVA